MIPKTKIICTLGPASSKETVIRKMMMAGMDVVRLNFSHGSYNEHLERLKTLRKLNSVYRRRIRILQDLEGYRIRIGKLKGGKPVLLSKRQTVYLTQDNITGTSRIIPFDYTGSLHMIKKGHLIFIDDGNIVLKVKERGKRQLKLDVLVGGILAEHKGVNMPAIDLEFSSITEKDRVDINFAITHKVDFVAQSFVCTPENVLMLKEILKHKHPSCKVIAKIENSLGLKNIDQIIDVSDGIMIARGDMGVSVPIYQLPILQKSIIRKCNKKRKFVITATQMLENMVEHIIPTRAEVTDVANSIFDGTNYVMLSAETAIGKYPVETVTMMNDIIKYTEKNKKFYTAT